METIEPEDKSLDRDTRRKKLAASMDRVVNGPDRAVNKIIDCLLARLGVELDAANKVPARVNGKHVAYPPARRVTFPPDSPRGEYLDDLKNYF